eukprot:108071_1
MSQHLEMKFKKLKPMQLMERKDPNKLVLSSDELHEYSFIHLHEGCSITVKPRTPQDYRTTFEINPYELAQLISHWYGHYIPPTYSMDIQHLILAYLSSTISISYGGKLFIKCKGNIIIEKGATIQVDSCGYKSGTYYTSGESCSGLGRRNQIAPNMGGGGAGLDMNGGGGGGGGYGTKGGIGYKGDNIDKDKVGLGGEIYGDKYLSTLHLGSGGGSGECNVGGDGGGSIFIECEKLIHYGSITANGGGAMIGAGAGSGGSIHLVIHDTITMNKESLIQTKGGYGGKWGTYGNGGQGRIRIDINKDFHKQIDDIIKLKRIHPRPFVCAKLNK